MQSNGMMIGTVIEMEHPMADATSGLEMMVAEAVEAKEAEVTPKVVDLKGAKDRVIEIVAPAPRCGAV